MADDKTVYEHSETVYEGKADTVPAGTPASEDGVTFEKGSLILGTYEVESDPIHGGMGSVWRVHHMGWDTYLALKRPKSELFQNENQKAMFIAECNAWINLGLHPYIVSCYYVREIAGTPSIFSEWMDGGSLESAINNGTLYKGTDAAQQERILDIAIQFARGLHYAHENGLIHQDVKPDNLLLTKEGDAKVADFGIAKARATLTVLEGDPTMHENADGTMLSASGAYTPAYCSMEQMDGKPLTRRTDIYSWAVSVMQMYVGSRPWANGVVAGLSCRGYFENTRVPVPQALQELLARCMEVEPNDRPHDFAEVEAKLQEIYKAEIGSDYSRPEPKPVAVTPDSLNNRALSFLDLGKPEEAVRCWEKAASITPLHVPTFYNRLLFKWRSAELDDIEALEHMERFSTNYPGSLVALAEALLHVERGDWKTARSLLSKVNVDDCRGDLLERYTALVRDYDPVERFPYLNEAHVAAIFEGMILFFTKDIIYAHDVRSGALLFEDPGPGIFPCMFIPNEQAGSFILLDNEGASAYYPSVRSKPVTHLFPLPDHIYKRQFGFKFRVAIQDDILSVYMTHKEDNTTFDPTYGYEESEEYYNVMHYVDRTNGAYLGNEILYHHCGPYWDTASDESYAPSPRAEKAFSIFGEYDSRRHDAQQKRTINRELLLQEKEDDVWQVCSHDGHCIQTLHADKIVDMNDSALLYVKEEDKENYHILRIPDTDQQVPWLVSKPYDLLTALAVETQANKDIEEFYAAYDSGDIAEALRCFEDYRNIPGRENDEHSRRMEDAIALRCVPVGIRFVTNQEASQREYSEETRCLLPVPDILQKKVKKAWNRARRFRREKKYPNSRKCDRMALFPDGRTVAFSVWNTLRERGNSQHLYLYDTSSEEIRYLSYTYLDDILWVSSRQPITPNLLAMMQYDAEFTLLPPLPERTLQIIEKNDGYSNVLFHPTGRLIYCYESWQNLIRVFCLPRWTEVCDTSDCAVRTIKEPCYQIRDLKIPELREFSRFADNAEFELHHNGWQLHVHPHDDPDQWEAINFGSTTLKLSRDGRELRIQYRATVTTFYKNSDKTTDQYIYSYRYISYNYKFPGWVDRDEEAQSYLGTFLQLHPNWTENDFDGLIAELQYRGFGYIRPEGVRATLAEMASEKSSPSDKRK